jgi:hypothetical protein
MAMVRSPQAVSFPYVGREALGSKYTNVGIYITQELRGIIARPSAFWQIMIKNTAHRIVIRQIKLIIDQVRRNTERTYRTLSQLRSLGHPYAKRPSRRESGRASMPAPPYIINWQTGAYWGGLKYRAVGTYAGAYAYIYDTAKGKRGQLYPFYLEKKGGTSKMVERAPITYVVQETKAQRWAIAQEEWRKLFWG